MVKDISTLTNTTKQTSWAMQRHLEHLKNGTTTGLTRARAFERALLKGGIKVKKISIRQFSTRESKKEGFLVSLEGKKSFAAKDVYVFMQKQHPERYVHQGEGFQAIIEPLIFEKRIKRVRRGTYEVISA